MRFGIATFVTDEGIHPARLGGELERRGFESVFIAEHTHIPVKRESPWPEGDELPRKYYRTLDPFVTLTAMAETTERLLLGTGILLLIERDPIIAAKEIASLDQLTLPKPWAPALSVRALGELLHRAGTVRAMGSTSTPSGSRS
ncbi:hypothetical protein GCM10023196_107130 [Actinoallomurus vinaceus]|uniref:Luciferase-like domain-containing protein n=1 Tax=Actinoallomurus vinaceus TaxID=1080074 RepID=A0ABP8UWC6_9ACTN